MDNTFNANEYIDELFNKGKEDIGFEYYDDEDLVSAIMHLDWSENDKNDFIDSFNQYFDEISNLNSDDRDKAKEIFNKYFKTYNKNNFFKDMSILGARANHLITVGCPKIIFENEIKTSINQLLLNQFAKDAFITREVSEFIEFDNK